MYPAISINGRFLTQPMAGVQRFAIEASKAMDELIGNGEYRELDGRIEICAPRQARDFPLRHIPLRRVGFGGGYFWEQAEFPFHTAGRFRLNLCGPGPLVTRDQIVVVHDATIRARPENFSPQFRAAYNFLIPRLIRRSSRSMTVSEFSRREIGRWYGVDVSRMQVCYLGADHISRNPADNGIIERLGLTGRKFFLGVGVSKNKNVDAIVAAYRKCGLDDTLLVLTGQRYAWIDGAQSGVSMDGIRSTGFVTDAELRALYEHALAMLSPSLYEGFGLPPVEAMLCGCPAIISNNSAMAEICGDAALQCGPHDIEELARLMRLVHDDPARRSALSAAGRARALRYTWRSVAISLLDLCAQLNGLRLHSPEADRPVVSARNLDATPRGTAFTSGTL
jgi:glycosyltransferase involved in cell wall biosynthesis